MKLRTIISTLAITSAVVLSASACLAQEPIEIAQNRRGRPQTKAQVDNPTYVGVGVSASGLAAYSKIALSDNFSIRPMLLADEFDDDFKGTVIVPLTYDFQQYKVGGAVPFAGIGGGTSTDNFDVGFELTAGIDYPISNRFTATGLFNMQLFGDNDIDAVVGLGINL